MRASVFHPTCDASAVEQLAAFNHLYLELNIMTLAADTARSRGIGAAPPRLNERCALLRPVETQAASGGMQTTWGYLSEQVYAAVEFPGTGTDEQFLGDQQVAVTRAFFTIRWRDDFDEKYRLEYAGEEYDIRNILPIGERRSYLKLIAEKRA